MPCTYDEWSAENGVEFGGWKWYDSGCLESERVDTKGRSVLAMPAKHKAEEEPASAGPRKSSRVSRSTAKGKGKARTPESREDSSEAEVLPSRGTASRPKTRGGVASAVKMPRSAPAALLDLPPARDLFTRLEDPVLADNASAGNIRLTGDLIRALVAPLVAMREAHAALSRSAGFALTDTELATGEQKQYIELAARSECQAGQDYLSVGVREYELALRHLGLDLRALQIGSVGTRSGSVDVTSATRQVLQARRPEHSVEEYFARIRSPEPDSPATPKSPSSSHPTPFPPATTDADSNFDMDVDSAAPPPSSAVDTTNPSAEASDDEDAEDEDEAAHNSAEAPELGANPSSSNSSSGSDEPTQAQDQGRASSVEKESPKSSGESSNEATSSSNETSEQSGGQDSGENENEEADGEGSDENSEEA